MFSNINLSDRLNEIILLGLSIFSFINEPKLPWGVCSSIVIIFLYFLIIFRKLNGNGLALIKSIISTFFFSFIAS